MTLGTIQLVIGSTGAGKSTYSRALSSRLSAVRFAIDEWMETLFLPDRPADAQHEWYLDRISRSTALIWDTVMQLANLGTSVVLEIGLTQRGPRAEFYQRVDDAGLSLRLHVVEAPRDVRWARVDARNRERGETFSMEVTRGMFDFVEGMWEPPEAPELRQRQGIIIDTTAAR